MHIRSETPAYRAAIAALITTAFRTAKVASGTEAEVVERLRASGALTLSLVAEEEGALIGHIAASPCSVGGQGGWACLGPLAVALGQRRQGIGAALLRAALDALGSEGWKGAVLVGDPGYYTRFGFLPECGVTLAGVPSAYVMAKPLTAPLGVGALLCHPALMP